MSEELLINVTPNETRVALVENGVLQEVQIERQRSSSIVGNIYKGKVNRVLPGMQAAFVDIGLDRAGFLHASDIPLLDGEGMELIDDAELDIHTRVHEGKTLMVQVVKAPMGP
ncbi:MAG: S1 RNA-binding domain-containing protein, partial [Pseudomonadales bacterium]